MIIQQQDMNMSEYKNKLSLKNKLTRALWNIAYWFLFRPFSLNIFRSWRIFVLNSFGAKIHHSSLVAASAKIWLPSNLVMKEFSLIAQKAVIYNVDIVTLGKNAIVSQKSYLCTASHDVFDRKHPLIHKPITLEDKVWVAAAAGMPIVCTEVCGAAPHFVIDGYNGYKVQSKNSLSLKVAMEKIITLTRQELISFSKRSKDLSNCISSEKGVATLISILIR